MNVRFNNAFLADLLIRGYKYMIFHRDVDVITMVPSATPFSREELELINMAQLSLTDSHQMNALQNLDLLEDFVFVIDSRYFADVERN